MNTSLYLFPADPYASPPEVPGMLDVLRKTGLLGKSLGNLRFLIGDRFFQHVSFAGCSPSMLLEQPQDGSDNFTHISLSGPFPQPRLVATRHHSRPRCPHCGQRLNDWKSQLTNWKENPATEYLCRGCNQSSKAATLDWRRYAACGRLLIEIHQVFPGEAVPGDRLMTELKKATGSEWLYAWADSSA
jgi:hypothetical protein